MLKKKQKTKRSWHPPAAELLLSNPRPATESAQVPTTIHPYNSSNPFIGITEVTYFTYYVIRVVVVVVLSQFYYVYCGLTGGRILILLGRPY